VSGVLIAVMALCVAVLIWHMATRSPTCTARLVKCGCRQRGEHSQHRCQECGLSWRDGQHGITFGGNP
jgi:transposase-like protein